MCDAMTYYCCDFTVYDKTPQPGLHTNVVLDLARDLPTGLNFTLILDRGFTSPLLLSQLSEMGHGATCTCIPNRKHYPKKDLVLKKNARQGESKAMVCEENGMLAVVWKDKRPVHFLTTAASK